MRRHALVTAALLAAGADVATADTLRVPRDHATIQDAVDVAQPGDEVVISRGEYAAVTVTSKTDLTIQGKGKVVIRPAGTGLRIDGCMRVVVRGISVQGGTIGIDVRNSAEVTIDAFSVAGTSSDGVYAESATGLQVSAGRIENCGNDGISFAGDAPGASVDASEISKCTIRNCDGDGIEIRGSDVTVTSCSVDGAGDDGFEANEDAAGPIGFVKCRAKDCGDEGFELFAPQSHAEKCSATTCSAEGFDVQGDGSTLEKCVAKRNRGNGFQTESVDGVALVGCKAISNDGDGFQLLGTTASSFEKCKAVKSGDDGFYIDPASSGNTLTGNKASKSDAFDLDDESGGGNTLDGNKWKTVDPNDG